MSTHTATSVRGTGMCASIWEVSYISSYCNLVTNTHVPRTTHLIQVECVMPLECSYGEIIILSTELFSCLLTWSFLLQVDRWYDDQAFLTGCIQEHSVLLPTYNHLLQGHYNQETAQWNRHYTLLWYMAACTEKGAGFVPHSIYRKDYRRDDCL